MSSKQPHYNTVSLITWSASMDPRDSVIMRLYCTQEKKKHCQAFAKVRLHYSFSLWYNENNLYKLSLAHLKLKDRVF